jgi:hypothetical protein
VGGKVKDQNSFQGGQNVSIRKDSKNDRSKEFFSLKNATVSKVDNELVATSNSPHPFSKVSNSKKSGQQMFLQHY